MAHSKYLAEGLTKFDTMCITFNGEFTFDRISYLQQTGNQKRTNAGKKKRNACRSASVRLLLRVFARPVHTFSSLTYVDVWAPLVQELC